jgi:hypothetical protein
MSSLDVNGIQTFTATVTGTSANNVSWQIYGGDPTLVGSFANGRTLGNGATVTYTAPPTPPVYVENTVGDGSFYHGSGSSTGDEGIISITAYIIGATGANASVAVNFPITGPLSTGILPASPSLQLGKFVTFTGYCVGSTNNNIAWQVNGVTGGSTATGTIVPQIDGSAFYTAPAAMPMSGNTVTVTAVCQVDPTKTASSTVTLSAS